MDWAITGEEGADMKITTNLTHIATAVEFEPAVTEDALKAKFEEFGIQGFEAELDIAERTEDHVQMVSLDTLLGFAKASGVAAVTYDVTFFPHADDAEVEYLEGTFANAERTTQVEVALVSLTVNKSKRSKDYFEDVLNKCNQERTEEFSLALPTTYLGYKEEEIKRLISLYNEHVKRFKAFFNALGDLSSYSKYVEDDTDLTTRNKLVDFNLSYNAELQKLRIAYWEKMLKTDQFRELLTSSAYADLMKKITALADMEPTLENVYTMLVSLSQNNKAILTSALEELFDKFTSYHQKEFSKNIHYYNGWKTNDAFKMNKKVITPIGGSLGWLRWERNGYQNVDYQVRERIEDVLKVVQLVSKVPPGEWQQLGDYEFENDLLRFKVFKKGTLHIWFKDLKALDKLNFIVGQEKNWLPTDDEIKTDDDAAKYIKKHFPNMDMEQLSYQ